MAIYHFTTRIVKASKGKCAVASAAYQAGTTLYDERLGETFSYKHKEEVVYSEVMLPENAPAHLQDRETLWNEVEKIQNKANSRYARQFEFSLPKEWSHEERIERAREFIQKNFVDKGMVADWSYHEKEGNPHIHVMVTTRGFNKDGSWASTNKSVYKLDEDGNKIPDIDKETGLQKVRVRPGKGEEKLWVRINNPANDWNKRETLVAWRKSWSEYANQFLDKENQIDHRSYAERGIEKVPGIHIAPGMNDMEQRGTISYQMQENRERSKINAFFDKAKTFLQDAKMQIVAVKDYLLNRGQEDGKGRSTSKDEFNRRVYEASNGIPGTSGRDNATVTLFRSDDGASSKQDSFFARATERISDIRTKLSEVARRISTLNGEIGSPSERERTLEAITSRVAEVKERRLQADGRAEQIRAMLLGTMGGNANSNGTTGTANNSSSESSRADARDTEAIIRKVRDASAVAAARISNSATSRANREAERQRPGTAESYGTTSILSKEGGETHSKGRGVKH